LALEDKYTDEVQKLIDIGKEKGYLLYDEVRDLLPPEINPSAEDLDDLFSAFGSAGIEVIEAEEQGSAGLDKIPAKGSLRTSLKARLNWTSRRGRRRQPTIPSGFISARRERFHCLPATAKL